MTTIEKLKNLDLSTYPYEEAKKLIEELFQFYSMLYVLPKGYTVLRARVNENNISFQEPKDLSYKPQQFNSYYQRASTPHKTAFYAAALPNTSKFSDVRVISTLETSSLIRAASSPNFVEDSTTDTIKEEIITYGKWEITKDLPLVMLFHSETFRERHPLTRDIYDSFYKSLKEAPEEYQQRSIETNDFFAKEFSKTDIKDDYDYLLSAVFTEVATERGFAGVLYPSVRCDGEGFNVAVSPEFVPNHLRLSAVGECKIYSKGKGHFLNDLSFSIIHPGQKRFTLHSLKGTRQYTDEGIIHAHLNGEIKLG